MCFLFITRSVSWDCLARQSISIDVLYNREFKSDDEVNISAEDKDIDVTIATDDHNRDFIFIRLSLIDMIRFARLNISRKSSSHESVIAKVFRLVNPANNIKRGGGFQGCTVILQTSYIV